MTPITVNGTITDPERLCGEVAARAAYNANPPEGGPPSFDSDRAYLWWVLENACASYPTQHPA